jgi:hypothetical protein
MSNQQPEPPFYERKFYRLITAAFGFLLAGVGGYALFFAETAAVIRFPGALGLLLLGYNMLSSAFRAKESWLSKIGPLP